MEQDELILLQTHQLHMQVVVLHQALVELAVVVTIVQQEPQTLVVAVVRLVVFQAQVVQVWLY